MTIAEIMKKYDCSRNDAINILTKLNTPGELGLTVKKSKSHQEKVADKITKK